MKARDKRGFTLVEFVIAIVFVGVVLGPFLLFVARIHDLNSAIGQQGRREAWRSFNDQAVAAGIDPTSAQGLTHAANPAVPEVAALPVHEGDVTTQPGLARIVPLQVVLTPAIAEARIAGTGYQIGAGAVVPPPTTPAAPLDPIVIPRPVVTPADGTVIPVTGLSAAPAGQPYTATIQAASASGTKVQLTLNQPFSQAQGLGMAQKTVTATELANRVSGTAWAEYAGDAGSGDQAMTLEDGRTRWLVTRPDGRRQIYEPSPLAPFAYQLGLGAPSLMHGSDEVAAGGSLALDYAGYYAVQSGITTLAIGFPSAVKVAFGSDWPSATIGFQWTFHDAAGAFSGDLRPFFLPETLSFWDDSIVVAATAVVPVGTVADAAVWTLTRVKTALGTPVLSSSADSSGFFAPGQMQFSAPNGPDGTPIGRLSFNNGQNLSTGPTLSITVAP